MRSAADSSQAVRSPLRSVEVGVGGPDGQDEGREAVAVAVPQLVQGVVVESRQVEGYTPPHP